jgi:hypothetical protein
VCKKEARWRNCRQPGTKVDAADEKEGLVVQQQAELFTKGQRLRCKFVSLLSPEALTVPGYGDRPNADKAEDHRNQADDRNGGSENGILDRLGSVLQQLEDD